MFHGYLKSMCIYCIMIHLHFSSQNLLELNLIWLQGNQIMIVYITLSLLQSNGYKSTLMCLYWKLSVS